MELLKIQANQDNNVVSVRVSNASFDISPSDRQLLFDRFYRGEQPRSQQIEGIGLGLSLAREIARSLAGDLILAAAISGETTFVFTLPTDIKLKSRRF